MEGCPLELQMLIFSFACTDDGSTGRSLSLVSRAFRQLSYPFQWSSLAIYGHAQASAFAKHLYSQPPIPGPPQRPIIHLFVSTRPALLAYDHIWLDMPSTWPGVLRSILRLVAPTLKTLAIISLESPMDSVAILSQALRVHYPCLVELTIRGRCTPHQLSHPPSVFVETGDEATHGMSIPNVPDSDDTTWPSLPNLRRLHIACAFQGLGRGTQAEHALISDLAPNLTHLRLSVLDFWGSKRLAEIVHAECAESGIVDRSIEVWPTQAHSPVPSPTNPMPGSSSAHAHSRRLSLAHLAHPLAPNPAPAHQAPTLQKATRVTWDRMVPSSPALELFVLQPPPTEIADFYCSCCMDERGDGGVMRVFEALQRASDERFLYLPRNTRSVYGFEEARADWLERVSGLLGCWAARHEDVEPPADGDASIIPVSGSIPDRQASGRRRRAVSFKSAVKRLQKVKFW